MITISCSARLPDGIPAPSLVLDDHPVEEFLNDLLLTWCELTARFELEFELIIRAARRIGRTTAFLDSHVVLDRKPLLVLGLDIFTRPRSFHLRHSGIGLTSAT